MPSESEGHGSRRGRPRIHATSAERVAAHREAHREEGQRLEVFLPPSATWRLKRLAQEWGGSRSAAIERLIMEADERYGDILFPETEPEK